MQKSNFKTINVEIHSEMIGQRIDRALSLHPEIQTRSRAALLIKDSLVTVNSKSIKASYIINANDNIVVKIPETKELGTIMPLSMALNILYEDADLIVLNKPAGLVVHPAAGHENDTLVNALVNHTKDLSMKFGENRPGIVHRLDRDTSGVMVVAKNDFTHENLTQQFKDRSIHRIYFALCFGSVKNNSGRICSYLARHPFDRKKYSSVLGIDKKIIRDQNNPPTIGKWSATNYEVLQHIGTELTYIKLKLETGRTHQIRVHLSESGHPIVGDTLYGADKKIKNLSNNKKELIKNIPRFALHAAELGFTHPKSKENLFFVTDWPQDLKPSLIELGIKL